MEGGECFSKMISHSNTYYMKTPIILLLAFLTLHTSYTQSLENHWSKQTRHLRYKPDGNDFVIVNGDKKFNRAIYGTNTAYRMEAGDLPEFAFYMPGFGGNFRFGIVVSGIGKWFAEADSIEARYRPGSMIYTIKDKLLGDGKIVVTALALADKEGAIFKVVNHSSVKNLQLIWAYGGATAKKFRRNGDLNTDPESVFYLKKENCKDNVIDIGKKGTFSLQFGKGDVLNKKERIETVENGDSKGKKLIMMGISPSSGKQHIGDGSFIDSPAKLILSTGNEYPVMVGQIDNLKNGEYLFSLFVPDSKKDFTASEKQLDEWYAQAEVKREKLASRIVVQTPDPFINNLGATLGIAADAIWEYPTYLHGAIGWRMRLNGWRGPYTADPLGWHDRAKAHFSSYAKSQVTTPASGPSVPDEKRNWARQQEKMGNALYTSGYICRNPNGDFRPHHYDMNLVFIDALLRHLRWTGDLDYAKEMWPVIERHLAWEKRNFDGDDDGLYDAYCCIWASDALEYSGGGVAHSSAYNYLGNKMAAEIASLIGIDPKPYQKEADKILYAIQTNLWLPDKGWFAEYKDWCGEKRTHDASALWTIYHVLDSEVADPFQRWESTRYVDKEIPRLPVKGKGLKGDGFFVHSTTNWQPYDWSINNVVMAENLHTALAYWQSGRFDEGYNLWKSTLLDAMYLGSSPGNFAQLSFLDAARGEMYRDFADEVGMTARSLVEGLFGIHPDAIHGKLLIQPGLPSGWDHASLSIPDVEISFKQSANIETYRIKPSFTKQLDLTLKVPALSDEVARVTLNGSEVKWHNDTAALEKPLLVIDCGISDDYVIEIAWKGEPIEKKKETLQSTIGKTTSATFAKSKVIAVKDPQGVFKKNHRFEHSVSGEVKGLKGNRTFFVQLQQGKFKWWMPVEINIVDPIEIIAAEDQKPDQIEFAIKNNTSKELEGYVFINKEFKVYDSPLKLKSGEQSSFIVRKKNVIPGSNLVLFECGNKKFDGRVINWNVSLGEEISRLEPQKIDSVFNDKVPQIFKNVYATPRWPYPTLQLPKQGIGNWCYNNIHPDIDDSGLRELAGDSNRIELKQGIVFNTPGQPDSLNVSYISLWDNYNNDVTVPLDGWGWHLYLLMVGSTNPMQSQITNGVIIVEYTDGTTDELELVNPENWWPIEQDYFNDGYAFTRNTPVPPRVHLKTGLITRDFKDYSSISGFSNRVIDGGSATVVDMPINPYKKLKSLKVKTLSNEVVIGLMSATILRD